MGIFTKAKLTRPGRTGAGKLSVLLACLLAQPLVTANQAFAALENTASARGFFQGNPVNSPTATVSIPVEATIPALTVSTTSSVNEGGNGRADAGDTITYTFDVTNMGLATLLNVDLINPLVAPGAPVLHNDVSPTSDSTDTGSAGWANLGPGDTIRFTATYTLTQADIDDGEVLNNVTANAITAANVPVSAGDTEQTTLNTASTLSLVKTGTPDLGTNSRADAGDLINYQFTVTNTGSTTLTNIEIDDPLVQVAGNPDDNRFIALLQGAATAADTIATATIDFPTGGPTEPRDLVELGSNPDLPQLPAAIHATRKLVNLTGTTDAPKVGDRIGIYFSLHNTGDVPLTRINVDQDDSTAFTAMVDYLAPNATDDASIIFTRVLGEADIAAGTLDLTATITAKARGRKIGIALREPLALADAKPLTEIQTASITPALVPSLAPGASTVFNAVYQVTQADVDAGIVSNTATALGLNPQNVSVSSQDTYDTPLTRLNTIALIKQAVVDLGPDSIASVGDTVNYSFTVTNTGNTTLTNVSISDPLVAVAGGTLASLLPGDSDTTTFTATYTLTQPDIDAGQVQNQALVTSKAPDASDVTDQSDDADVAGNDSTVSTLTAAPQIALIKRATGVTDINNNGMTDVGDRVNFTFDVSNTGNVTLSNVYIQDRDINVAITPAAPTGVSVAPGATDTTTFTGTYLLTQADLDRGYVESSADVMGTAPDTTIVQDESHDAAFTQNGVTRFTITQQPGIAVLLTATVTDVNNNTINDLGDIINFTYTVVNTGNLTLTGVSASDSNTDAGVTGSIATLAPGQSVANAFTGSHTINLADMLAGSVSNQATVSATAANSATVTDLSHPTNLTANAPTVTTVVVNPAVALKLVATGITDVNNNSMVDAGDRIDYTYSLTNTGNVSLTAISITDPKITVAGTLNQLDPGVEDTTSFTGSYVLTLPDLVAGQFAARSQVQATGGATVVTDESHPTLYTANEDTITTFANAPEIAAILTVSGTTNTNNDADLDAGELINYVLAVTNTGDVPLINVTPTPVSGLTFTGTIPFLAVGATSTAITATHIITQDDLNAGQASVNATVTATSPIGIVSDISDNDVVTEDDPTVLPLTQMPEITLLQWVTSISDTNNNGRNDVGDVINYGYRLHNTGNVRLLNVTVSDNIAVGEEAGLIAYLDPGDIDATTFTSSHTITLADSEAGEVVVQSLANGSTPTGATVTDWSDNDTETQNDETVQPVTKPQPVLSMSVARSEIRRGERAVFTITASGLGAGPYDITDFIPAGFDYVAGTAVVNGIALEPTQDGSTLAFGNLAPNSLGRIIIKLSLVSPAAASNGKFVNKARLYLSSTSEVLGNAQAAVTIKDEHVFDCGEVIGRVFDDLNGNGYADEGEPGLPAVRVVTVNGVLITTDSNGRFHVGCADIPHVRTGSTFVMKLDTRSLPEGYNLTSENPRDVRLTRGKITKLNFGASRQREVRLDLTRDAFLGETTNLKPQWATGVDRLVSLLEQGKGGLRIVYKCGQDAPLAEERAAAVKDLVMGRWMQAGGGRSLPVKTEVNCGKSIYE